MISNKRIAIIAGWIVFVVAFIAYYLTAERTGSLWDCGEFILGAYKLQVVHPPGAPLFEIVGRLFTWVATLFSNNPENIAFSVNLMSGISSAMAAAFICWTTIALSKLTLVGREGEMTLAEAIATAGGGIVAGLATAFATSVWFSAVEGEVYAMSTFFTTMTLWSVVKWYGLPDDPQHDRWLLFAVYAAGLSIGVHLLSLLTFPALALFYYFKKYRKHTLLGMAAAALAGVLIIVVVQRLIIVGIPILWSNFELMMVNGLGMPFQSGLIPTILGIAALIIIPLMYAQGRFKTKTPLYILGGLIVIYTLITFGVDPDLSFSRVLLRLIVAAIIFGVATLKEQHKPAIELVTVGIALVIISFSTIGIVVLRANAAPPVNMNAPSDAMRLIPYLNREQYGERPLLRGTDFQGQPVDSKSSPRYGRVGDHYEVTDYKLDYIYDDADKMLFPRMGDYTSNRPQLYKIWMNSWRSDRNQVEVNKPLPAGELTQWDNLNFLFRYQLGWMYWRYFMWNFAGRQNGEQGFYPWDKSSGHWISGIKPLDEARLYNESALPDTIKEDQARNKYYLLPFLFGLAGLFFHFQRRPNDALALLAMFIITGIGIIIYSNQPPNEPRERDYVLVGSFFTFAIWMGMAVPTLFDFFRTRVKLSGPVAASIASIIILSAPVLMGTQNFDDNDRSSHKASRDYAANFLNSCAPNAIIFTYGDNDTYPLWYSQEVEGIRPDVRVVNLSLIAVDWYIDLLRRKVNDSPAINMSLTSDMLRGSRRNQIFYVDHDQNAPDPEISVYDFLKYIGEDHPVSGGRGRNYESHYYSKQVYIPVDRAKLLADGVITAADSANVPDRIPLNLNRDYLLKDDLAVLDIIASNMFTRPVYFAVTCRPEKLFGMEDFMKLEGLSLRVTPVKGNSDPVYGIIGSGRVDTKTVYDNVMNKFRWGNFDTHKTFVDRSYTPSVQSTEMVMRRTAMQLVQEGDTTKGVNLIEKYFKAFPDMNFPYDYRTMWVLDVLFQANAYDKAKPHLEILANRIEQNLKFYASIDPNVIESSFRDEYSLTYRTMSDLQTIAQQHQDSTFAKALETRFKPYQLTQPEGAMPPSQ